MTVWAVFAALVLLAFACIEAHSLATGQPTLSCVIWRLQIHFPLFAFLAGSLVGGLAVHWFGFLPRCDP